MRPDLSCYRDLMGFIWIHGNPYVFHVFFLWLKETEHLDHRPCISWINPEKKLDLIGESMLVNMGVSENVV